MQATRRQLTGDRARYRAGDLTRYLARRFAWQMLGGAIGLALVLLVYSLLNIVAEGLPAWLVAVATVAAAIGLGLVPGARELEVTAARALLDVDDELVVPARPRAAHRLRTAAWVAGHLASGLLVAAGLFAGIPMAVLIGAEAVAGEALRSGDSFYTGLPLPTGPVSLALRLVLCAALALLALIATWPLGAAAAALAGRVLGPTPHDRMETALARARREAEHTRLARELHDGIGHALTVVSVQAAAGRRVVAVNPDAAADALAAIEETARSALAELDQLLAVLRDDADDDAPVALTPALDDVVSAHRRAGLDLSAHLDLPAGLPALLGRTVQRIVTEALTNAHRHGAPGPVLLTVGHGGDEVRIEVVNPVRPGSRPGRRSTGGRGLSGIRERVALFGGTVHAGPDGDRWTFRATLPCAPRAAAGADRKDPDA
ncbi:sensor histidine kinase [Promicromonospora sp. CA-289599]|uniref:sensor histidine kinase n=1 Tax=Promicromonospora sp. CA-289599 TaxID=3240014 RepID=UPI003D8C8713